MMGEWWKSLSPNVVERGATLTFGAGKTYATFDRTGRLLFFTEQGRAVRRCQIRLPLYPRVFILLFARRPSGRFISSTLVPRYNVSPGGDRARVTAIRCRRILCSRQALHQHLPLVGRCHMGRPLVV